MASVKKFTEAEVYNQIRHIERTIENPGNKDIDPSKIDHNYYLSPARDMTSYQYYRELRDSVYMYNRKDVKVLAGWIITQPQDLLPGDSDRFFSACYDFLNATYGGESACISCVVHADEAGEMPHMHYLFVPLTSNNKYKPAPQEGSDTRRESEKFEQKICANDVLTRDHLISFHTRLQHAVDAAGLSCRVKTGVTRRQGGNRTVAELKAERPRLRDRGRWHDDPSVTRNRERGRW